MSTLETSDRRPTTVALLTLGCARNDVDSEELAARLEADGFLLVDDAESADTVVVNTCGFVEEAKKDSVDALLAAADLKETGPTQAVVAVGCMAERYGNELADSLPEADAVLGFDDYPDIAGRLRSILAGEQHVAACPSRPACAAADHAGRPGRERTSAVPGHGIRRAGPAERTGPGQRTAGDAPPARLRPDGAAQARLGLRPSLHVLRDPELSRLVRFAPPDRGARRGPLARRARACASCSWSARTRRRTARTSATCGCSRRCCPS